MAVNGQEGARLQPIGRFDWERIVRRIVMPKPAKYLAFVLATYADPNGTRVRPGIEVLAAVTGDSDKTVRRLMGVLRTEFGLLELTSRGGGRGGRGRASEYRLTIPEDLLDRHAMLGPDGRPDDSSVTQVTGQSPDPPVTQMTDDCGQPLSTDGDSSDSPVTIVTDQSPVDNSNDRSSGTPSPPIDRSNPPIDRSPCMTDYQPPDQPLQDHPSGPDPTQPLERTPVDVDKPIPHPRPTLDELLPLARPPRPPRGPKCHHGLAADRQPDGTPRCPLCRRDAVTSSAPHPLTHAALTPTPELR